MTIKHLQHVGKRALPWLIITLAALIALPQPAQAAPGDLVFTIEAPGVQVSYCPAGLVVQRLRCRTCRGFSRWRLSPHGICQSVQLHGSPKTLPTTSGYSPAGQLYRWRRSPRPTNFISTPSSYLLTLDAPAGYFGFWWSAGDGNNKVTVNMADGTSQVFTTQSILDSGAVLGTPGSGGQDGHFGNQPAIHWCTLTPSFLPLSTSSPPIAAAKIESLPVRASPGGGGRI